MAIIVVHYYEDATNNLVHMHLSGSVSYHTKINDANAFQLAIDAAKQIPAGKRNYDPKTFVWTFDEGYFYKNLLPFYQKAPMWFSFYDYDSLLNWEKFLGIFKEEEKPRINPQDPDHVKAAGFFHNFNTVVEQAVNTQGDKKTLAELLQVSDYSLIDRSDSVALKKMYRSAAMRLHPDRNNGDGSKMATLTQLWGIYVQPRN